VLLQCIGCVRWWCLQIGCSTLTPAQVMSAHTPTRYTSCSSVKRATTRKGTSCTQVEHTQQGFKRRMQQQTWGCVLGEGDGSGPTP
jgi:hypothetical protein